MSRTFGINLGTTNSEIAIVNADGNATVFEIENGMRFMPSAVGLDPSGRVITGMRARNQYAAFPENTVLSVKRKMGSDERIPMGNGTWSPVDISAEILKALKAAVEKETGDAVEQVVITVPAYFTDAQRRDTISAGEAAGLEVVRIINEPTAAALAYGCRTAERETILVYDLGGGTFDVSLIDVEDGVIEVTASDGDSHLGGDDFDRLLVDFLLSTLPEDSVDPEDARLRARLRNVAESVKVELSTATTVDVNEEFVGMREGKPVHLKTTVTRQDYEELISDTLDKTFEIVDRVISDAGYSAEDIDKALLVGGSTYTPLVRSTLRERGLDVHHEIDPSFCVAMGAALQGSIIDGEEVDTILVDVISHSLGIRVIDGGLFGYDDDRYSIIIHRNSPIPASMSRTYYTAVPNQKAVEIEAFQGKDPVASKNTRIGSFTIENLPARLPAESEVDVTFTYDLNGVVNISAKERNSGTSGTIDVDLNRAPELSRETRHDDR